MGMDGPSDQTTRPSRPGVMTEGGVTDAISLLTDDHRKVDRLFKRYEELGSGNEDERGRLVDEISDELTVHAAIEEEVFYPAVRELLAEGDELVDESLHEHQEVKDNLAELEGLEPGLARFDATVATLISNVRHHVGEEEGEIFPKLRAAIGQPQLVELGRRLTQAKEEELGSIVAAAMVSVAEEDIVVSMFEVPEPELAPPPARRATVRPQTAKRPTPKRPTRRLAKKSTAKKSVRKRVAAKKSTAKKPAKRSTAKKSASRKSSARKAAATRRSTTAKRSTAAKKAVATRKSRAKKAVATRKSRAKKAVATRKSSARKAASARKSTARTRSRSRTSTSRGRSSSRSR